MKSFLVALMLLATPALAETKVCTTPEAFTNIVLADEKDSYIYYKLYQIDIGNTELADVIIFAKDNSYLAAVFEKQCFVGYEILDEDEVIHFLNAHLKEG
jgi:cytidylate kinase